MELTNKGTGAGGKNTNYYGKQFEEKTSSENFLINNGFIRKEYPSSSTKYNYYLHKIYEDKQVFFTLQNGLKKFAKNRYNLDLFRCPDEAYIIEFNDGRKVVNIIEKKEQNREGSVETKMWSCPSLKREYELIFGVEFSIEYSLCINEFLENKIKSNETKYNILKIILQENRINILFGDDENYFETLRNYLRI